MNIYIYIYINTFVFPKMTFFDRLAPGIFLQCHKLISKFELDVSIFVLLYLKSWFNVDAPYY